MEESPESMKEKSSNADERKRYDETRYQKLEEELKILQSQIAFQRKDASQVAAKDINIRERINVDTGKHEKELTHREDGSESELERKKAELELLQRQIASKRRQPLNSAASSEIEQVQRKTETEKLQTQIAIGKENEKDTGEVRMVEQLQSGMQGKEMPTGLSNTEYAIANRKVELERLQKQIAMRRREKMLSTDSEIERQYTDMLQSGLRNKQLQYSKRIGEGRITDKYGDDVHEKERTTMLLHNRSSSSKERMKSFEDTSLDVFSNEVEEGAIMKTLVRSVEKKEAELQRLRSQIALRKRQASLNEEKQMLSEMLTRLTQSTDHNTKRNIVSTYTAYNSETKDKPDQAKDNFSLQEVRYEAGTECMTQEQQRDRRTEIPKTPIETPQRRDSLHSIDKEIRDLDLRLETLKQDEMRDKRRKEETETLLKTIDKASQRRDVREESNQPEQVYDIVRPKRSEYDKAYEPSLHPWSSRIPRNTEREIGLESQITNQRVKSPVSARRQLKFEDSENFRSVAVQTPSEERSYNSFYESQYVPQESKKYDRQSRAERRPVYQYTYHKDIDSLQTFPGTKYDYYQGFEWIDQPKSDYSVPGYEPAFNQEKWTRQAECLATDQRYVLGRNIKSEVPLPHGMIKTELPDMLERIRLEDINRREIYLKEKEEALMNKEWELDMRERILELREEINKETPVEKDANTNKEEISKDHKKTENGCSKERKEETNIKEAVSKNSTDTVTTDKRNNSESISCQDRSSMYPKFTQFSGEDPKPKGEATFEEWKYEVCCALKDEVYKEYTVAQAIRKSLKSQAKRVLLPMGTTATVQEILERLEGVFGNVATGESVLQEFYTAAQKADESVTTWGLRLEEILQKAVIKGHVKPEDKNDMLRSNFWKHLRSEKLKNATRVHFESISNFELLRRAVRAEEYEIKVNTGIQHQPTRTEVKCEEKDKEESKMDALINRLASLEKEMKEIRKNRGFNYQKRFQYNQPKQDDKRLQYNQPKQDETKPKEPLN